MKGYIVFKILIWCMSWYAFSICLVKGIFLLLIQYTLWYMISICVVYKEWPEKWQWLKMSDQILLILAKTELVYWLVNDFFVIPPLCSIPEAMRNDYFWLVYVLYTAKRYMYSDLFYLLCQSTCILYWWQFWTECCFFGNQRPFQVFASFEHLNTSFSLYSSVSL